MKTTRHIPSSDHTSRCGLAPLELVLALPMMLFAMALMVNIGTVGAWKVREQANVRNASWRTLHLRTGDWNPNPPMWPTAETVNGTGGNTVNQVNQRWNVGHLATPSVRGPAVSVRDSLIVVNPTLKMHQGVHDGRAPLERTIPMLRGILPNDGKYEFDIAQNILDGTWEYHQLQVRGDSYRSNTDRRARLLYETVRRFGDELKEAENGPMQALVDFGSDGRLVPLDNDPDLRELSILPPKASQTPPEPPPPYAGASNTPRDRRWSPDFYPRLRRRLLPQYRGDICKSDPNLIRSDERYESRPPNENGFLNRIRHLPGTMGRTFKSWYQARIDYLQQQDPPIAGGEQEIQELQGEIDKLDQFLGDLPRQNR